MMGRASAPTKSLKRAPIAVSSPSSPRHMFKSATPTTHPLATGPKRRPTKSAREDASGQMRDTRSPRKERMMMGAPQERE